MGNLSYSTEDIEEVEKRESKEKEDRLNAKSLYLDYRESKNPSDLFKVYEIF